MKGCYMNSNKSKTKYITIDGGEWLKGAGEFNMFTEIADDQWDAIEMMVRGAKSE